MKSSQIPKFGPLSGVKVLVSGLTVAGPYAGSLMADFGAEVINIENPITKDPSRQTPGAGFAKERRNERGLVLNIPTPEGKEVFLKLLKDADILIESSKGGQWAKWGLGDEVLWQHNPKLVIAHVSGFGQSGVPEYVGRGSWDSIGQAFGGLMFLNGNPAPEPAAPAAPYTADYFTALFASWSCLAAYINVQKTGQGESIDVAQFESVLAVQGGFPTDYFTHGIERQRTGWKNAIAGWQAYKCKDGDIFVCFIGASAMKNGLPLIGLEWGSPEFPKGNMYILAGTPEGDLVSQKLAEYCAIRTIEELDQEFNSIGLAASPIMTYELMDKHPHFQAREVFAEWEDANGQIIKGQGIIPKFKNNPGKIWKAAPSYGQDNEDILAELGFTPEQISELYDKKITNKD